MRPRSVSWSGLLGGIIAIIIVFGLIAVFRGELKAGQVIGITIFSVILIALIAWITGAPIGGGKVRY